MITYEQWNKAIISYFFEDCEPGETVFLQTDADTLLEIARRSNFDVKEVDETVSSLTEAVRAEVVYGDLVDFWNISPAKTSRQGEHSEEKPSQVAFLALTVLAASRMDKSEEASHTNYYVQLHRLLHSKPNHGIPKGIKYKEWEGLWKHLQKWARNQFNLELYLTEGSPKKRYVWYPISQCLISKYDEYRLQIIFQEADLKPGAYLAESQLLNILRSCRSFPKLSMKIKRPILQKNTAEIRLVLGQIQLLLENWDGKVQERTSLRIAKRRQSSIMEVQLKFNTFRSEELEEIRYWFRRGGSSQITVKLNSLNAETLQLHNDEWFEPFVDADCSSLQVLQNGVEIKSEEIKSLTYKLKPSGIWVFRIDSEPDDGWFSQGNLLLHEVHRIVFRKEQNLQVTSILQHVCEPFVPSKSICVGGKETDWQYVEVKPTVIVSKPIFGYHITTSDKISFVGGLPLDRRSNSYFDFCLPTIVVPNLVSDSNDLLYFNGQERKVPKDRKIELPDNLSPGEYKLSYLNCQPTLRVISPSQSSAHESQTLAIHINPNSKIPPSFKDYQIAEIPEESEVWLAGAKFFGEDNIPNFVENDEDSSALSAAELVSSVVKIAIELKQENASPPEWFYKAIKNLNQDVALQALVEKRLNDYSETALSYQDLCSLGGD